MMKTKRISLIIGLMGLALMGVMAMQFYFLRESYQLQSELFDRSVSEALSSVVGKVEKRDAISFMERMKTPVKKTGLRGRSRSQHRFIYTRISETIPPQKQSNSKLHPEIERKQRRLASIKDSLKTLSDQFNNSEDILSYQQVHVEEYIDEHGQLYGKVTQ